MYRCRHGHIIYSPFYYTSNTAREWECPICRDDDLTEVEECDICGELFDTEDLEEGVCYNCKLMTFKSLAEVVRANFRRSEIKLLKSYIEFI